MFCKEKKSNYERVGITDFFSPNKTTNGFSPVKKVGGRNERLRPTGPLGQRRCGERGYGRISGWAVGL
jgi:hypothetical protein